MKKPKPIQCPYCDKKDVTAGHIMGHMSRLNPSDKQREASRINGKLGGRPRKNKK